MPDTISSLFKSLYLEFLEHLQSNELLNNTVTLQYDRKPFVEFQFVKKRQGGELDLDELSNLQSYDPLITLVADHEDVEKCEIDKKRYGLFFYIFSDFHHHLLLDLRIPLKYFGEYVEKMELEDEKISKAILESVSDMGVIRREKYLVIFENLKIQSDYDVHGSLKLVRLNNETIRTKMVKRQEPAVDWARVHCAFETDEAFVTDHNAVAMLSTLLRLFRPGDIRFKAIRQEADHFIKGQIYISHKNTISETDYYEHTPLGNLQYLVTDQDSSDLIEFINTNWDKMQKMAHSCQFYNIIGSSQVQLRLPLLFFVIESFFADIKTEVKFRISLYVTKILGEDDGLFNLLKKLYDIRSSIAHGDMAAAQNSITNLHKKGLISMPSFQGVNECLLDIVNRLWIRLLEIDWDPKKSAALISDHLFVGEETDNQG